MISATCQCLSLPHTSAHKCHISVLISAHQCHIVPTSVHQCHIVPIRAAFQCQLSVPVSAAYQCPS
ncbi:unnamed protein product, partial [Staurois parvus]